MISQNNHRSLLFIVVTTLFLPTLASGQKGPPPALVEVVKVIEKNVREEVTLVGSVESPLDSIVASEVEGVVEKRRVKEGKWVKKGDVLAELGSTQLKIRLKGAEAELESAKIELVKGKQDLERSKKLKERGAISIEEFKEDALEVGDLEQRVLKNETETERLKDLLQKTRAKAPFSGVVAEVYTEVGEWIDKGGKIARLVSLNPVRVRVDLPEEYLPRIKSGAKVVVSVDALSGSSFQGRIQPLPPQGEKGSRTFPVRVLISNPESTVKVGMLARVTLKLGKGHKALMVKKDGLVKKDGGSALFKVEKGKAVPVMVTTGASEGSYVEITGNVKKGDLVVVRGNERLRPGQAVKISTVVD